MSSLKIETFKEGNKCIQRNKYLLTFSFDAIAIDVTLTYSSTFFLHCNPAQFNPQQRISLDDPHLVLPLPLNRNRFK